MAYPTTANCKTYMNITGASEDTEIGWMRDAVVANVEAYCHRTFVAGNATRSYPSTIPFITQDRRVLTFGEDLVSVTTLTNGDLTVITEYDLWPVDGPPYYQLVIRQSCSSRFAVGTDGARITLLGSWGYSAACPDDIFLAIMELVELSYAGKAEGPGLSMTTKGLIVDKAKWPQRMLRVLDLRKR